MLNENPESAREIDQNGYLLVKDNPIIRAGVFQYKGSQLPDGDPEKIYNVYRPLEELSKPETLESLRGLPIIDEHEMLGDRYQRSPEERGVHGSVLENISLKGDDVLANLRIWSRTLKSLLDAGKKGLSLGYNCRFEKSSGTFAGMAYHYIQRNIRGNHLALVTHGRNGTDVLDNQDVFDHFDLALDTRELNMADDDKKDEKAKANDAPSKENPSKDDTSEKEMSMSDVTSAIKKLMPLLEHIEKIRDMTSKTSDDDAEALDDDTKEKSGDQAKDEKDEKKDYKAMDATKDKAMDAAEIGALVDTKLKADRKNMLGDITKRDSLAKDLVPLIGTFDHSAMDSADVAKYGIEKLQLSAEKGQEASVLAGYLAGRKAGSSKDGFALDSALPKPKEGGLLTKRLNNAA